MDIKKSTIVTRKMETSGVFKDTDIFQITIGNYDTSSQVGYTIDGVRRVLPVADPIHKIPIAEYRRDNLGHEFDIEILFDITGIGSVVIEVSKYDNKTC